MNDETSRKHVGETGRRIAFNQHNASIVRKKFQEILKSIDIE